MKKFMSVLRRLEHIMIVSILFSVGMALVFSDLASARTLEDIKKSGVIRIGTRIKVGKMLISKDGQKSGLQYDLAEAFAQYLGVELEMIPIESFSEYFYNHEGVIPEGIKEQTGAPYDPEIFANDIIDLAAETVLVLEWRQDILTMVPWLPTRELLFMRKGVKLTQDEDLLGKKIIVRANTSYEQEIQAINAKLGGQLTISYAAETDTEVLQKVSTGEFDASIMDSPDLFLLSRSVPNIVPAYPVTGQEWLAWVMKKGNHELAEAAKGFFDTIREDGTYNRLWEKEYGISFEEYLRALDLPAGD